MYEGRETQSVFTWQRIMTWVTLGLVSLLSVLSSPVRTDRTKSPGWLWLSLTRKLPFFPFSVSSFSASLPDKCPWNHLGKNVKVKILHVRTGFDSLKNPLHVTPVYNRDWDKLVPYYFNGISPFVYMKLISGINQGSETLHNPMLMFLFIVKGFVVV